MCLVWIHCRAWVRESYRCLSSLLALAFAPAWAGNEIGDAGGTAIADALKVNSMLQELYLNGAPHASLRVFFVSRRVSCHFLLCPCVYVSRLGLGRRLARVYVVALCRRTRVG